MIPKLSEQISGIFFCTKKTIFTNNHGAYFAQFYLLVAFKKIHHIQEIARVESCTYLNTDC